MMWNLLQEKPGGLGALSKVQEAEELGRCVVRRLSSLQCVGTSLDRTGILQGLTAVFPEATPVYIR